MRTSLSVDGGSVCASATKPIGRRTERAEPGTRAGRQRIRPVTWITWQTEDDMQAIYAGQNENQVDFELTDALEGGYTIQRENRNIAFIIFHLA